MGFLGIEGLEKPRRVRTAKVDQTAVQHSDLVPCDFTAAASNQLWVTDLAFVTTWAGVAYVCFIIDACSRNVLGWWVTTHMKTETVLDAIDRVR